MRLLRLCAALAMLKVSRRLFNAAERIIDSYEED